MGVLLVEQNLGAATAVCERQLAMVGGQIATETTATALLADPEAQRRYLGVEPLAREVTTPRPADCSTSLRRDESALRADHRSSGVLLRRSGSPCCSRSRPVCGGSDSTPSTSVCPYGGSRDGDYAIFGMNADGLNQHRLTQEHGDPSTPAGLEFQIEPSWSPDGTMIAFASSREGSSDIYVMKDDGTGTRRLTSSAENDQHPAWSSDGEQIVFDRSVEGGRLFVMDADGGGQRRLTDDTAEEGDPAWSPDGATIAYSRRTPGSDVREIWLVDADGSNPRQLTKLGAVGDRARLGAGRHDRRVRGEAGRLAVRHLHHHARRRGPEARRDRLRRRVRAGVRSRR